MLRLSFIKKNNFKIHSKDIITITIGTLLMGIGYSFFLMPFQSCPGGISGISQVLYYLSNFPVGLGMLLFNIPLFIIGIITIGRSFSLKTVLAILLIPFWTEVVKIVFKMNSLSPFIYKLSTNELAFTNEIFLGVVAGALFIGTGTGLVIKSNASTGGTDIPALLMRKHFGLTIGSSYLIIDSIIILSSGILLKNANIMLWSYIALFITSKTADQVIEGFSYTKAAHIITDKPEKIKNYIIKDLGRTCTLINSQGAYTNKDKTMIYVVINRRELARLKINVEYIDPNAFIIVNDVHQVLGLGYKKFNS